MRILKQPLVNSCQLCLKRRCVSRSVLAGGALPVVDGFVAAFDGPTGVLLASYALKPLLRTRARHVHTSRHTCPVFNPRACRRGAHRPQDSTITFPKAVMTGAVAFPTHWDL